MKKIRLIIMLSTCILILSCENNKKTNENENKLFAQGCFFSEKFGKIYINDAIYFEKYAKKFNDWNLQYVGKVPERVISINMSQNENVDFVLNGNNDFILIKERGVGYYWNVNYDGIVNYIEIKSFQNSNLGTVYRIRC